jgi:hypothetical protein
MASNSSDGPAPTRIRLSGTSSRARTPLESRTRGRPGPWRIDAGRDPWPGCTFEGTARGRPGFHRLPGAREARRPASCATRPRAREAERAARCRNHASLRVCRAGKRLNPALASFSGMGPVRPGLVGPDKELGGMQPR